MVCDNGVGFDTSMAEQAVGVFQRLHATNSRHRHPGSATVKRIVERHDGRSGGRHARRRSDIFFPTSPYLQQGGSDDHPSSSGILLVEDNHRRTSTSALAALAERARRRGLVVRDGEQAIELSLSNARNFRLRARAIRGWSCSTESKVNGLEY